VPLQAARVSSGDDPELTLALVVWPNDEVTAAQTSILVEVPSSPGRAL
jgi:hypothetical protein